MSFKIKDRKELFVEAFCGDAVEAARIAGFPNPEKKGPLLLDDPAIQGKLKYRAKIESRLSKVKASREERQEFWSSIMRNNDPYTPVDQGDEPPPPIPLNLRLKASELLGRSETDFIEKLDMSVSHSLADIITQAYQIPDTDIEEISYEDVDEKETSDEEAGHQETSDEEAGHQETSEEKLLGTTSQNTLEADIEDLI